jgi:UDP-N-acetylglucosamine--N-acetylmuramyl-(pentapeptide) pyrophosphoryl-undecaprenol N-acetylglucosamine transferase
VATLLVASTGGHLTEMRLLWRRFDRLEPPIRWVTFDTPQSRSALEGEAVDMVRFVGGRDPGNVLRNVPAADRILRQHRIGTVISTGSAVALPFFALARMRRLECHFIESAARMAAPSTTGGMIARIPGVRLYCQYPSWQEDVWRHRGSVFDAYTAGLPASNGRQPIKRVVVTLGTFKAFGFRRLVERLLDVLPDNVEVLWQTGDTDVTGLNIVAHHAIPEADLLDAMREADAVISHAGVGNTLAAFQVGKCPLLVPRRIAFGEHVDDHQIEMAAHLAERGLVVTADADDLTLADIEAAAWRRVTGLPDPPMFRLDG